MGRREILLWLLGITLVMYAIYFAWSNSVTFPSGVPDETETTQQQVSPQVAVCKGLLARAAWDVVTERYPDSSVTEQVTRDRLLEDAIGTESPEACATYDLEADVYPWIYEAGELSVHCQPDGTRYVPAYEPTKANELYLSYGMFQCAT